jgi:hypothetical protein
MSLTKLDENMNYIQSLADKPAQSSAELKKEFDKAGTIIKEYINQILTVEIDSKVSELSNKINSMYPIGSIYMSVNSTNPSTLFGGTWVAWGQGKVPVGFNINETEFNESEKTGGAKTHNHTTGNHQLTINEMPSHTHIISSSGGHSHTVTTTYSNDATVSGSAARVNGSGTKTTTGLSTIGNNTGSHTHNPSNTGGGAAHNHGNTGNSSNLQPYITCYMWKRTA